MSEETQKAQSILDENYQAKMQAFADAWERVYAPMASVLAQVEWAEKRVILRRKFKGKRMKLRPSTRIYLNTPPPTTFHITSSGVFHRYEA